MVVGYFMPASHTETGGLHAFLQKISDDARSVDVTWQRLFPAVQKPGPKPERSTGVPTPSPTFAQPVSASQGMTGDKLIQAMKHRLKEYHRHSQLDVILLEDDADCRFNTSGSTAEHEGEAFIEFEARLQQEVSAELGREIPVVALLASPEVETWLLADWERSFQADYPSLSFALSRHLVERLGGGGTPDAPERFGGPCLNGSCSHKLSDTLAAAFRVTQEDDAALFSALEALRASGHRATYSKRIEGPAMLGRVRPEVVAKRCTLYFRPAYQRLLRLLAVSSQPPT